MSEGWFIALAVIACLAAVMIVARRYRASAARRRRQQAIQEFDARRPALEVEFLSAAAATGKPRGLRWVACKLDGASAFAVDRANDDLYALVGATVSFDAVEGGGMEDVEAVSNLRAATAVFVHRQARWTTDGRVVFNLDPAGTLHHYRESLAPYGG